MECCCFIDLKKIKAFSTLKTRILKSREGSHPEVTSEFSMHDGGCNTLSRSHIVSEISGRFHVYACGPYLEEDIQHMHSFQLLATRLVTVRLEVNYDRLTPDPCVRFKHFSWSNRSPSLVIQISIEVRPSMGPSMEQAPFPPFSTLHL